MSLVRELLFIVGLALVLSNAPRGDALDDVLTGDGLQSVEDALNESLGNPVGSSSWVDLTDDPDPSTGDWYISKRNLPGKELGGTYLADGTLVGTVINPSAVNAMAGPWKDNEQFLIALVMEILTHEHTHTPPGDVPGGGGEPGYEPGSEPGTQENTCEHLENFQKDATRSCNNAGAKKVSIVLLGGDLDLCAQWAAHCRFYKAVADIANTSDNAAKAAECPNVDVDADGNLVPPTCVWCEPLTECSGVVGTGQATDTEFGSRQGE